MWGVHWHLTEALNVIPRSTLRVSLLPGLQRRKPCFRQGLGSHSGSPGRRSSLALSHCPFTGTRILPSSLLLPRASFLHGKQLLLPPDAL